MPEGMSANDGMVLRLCLTGEAVETHDDEHVCATGGSGVAGAEGGAKVEVEGGESHAARGFAVDAGPGVDGVGGLGGGHGDGLMVEGDGGAQEGFCGGEPWGLAWR